MSYIRKIKKGDSIYLAEVESRWINGKSVQRHIRYIGKESDGRTILSTSISDVEVEEVKLYGPLLVLHHLAKKIGLIEKLGFYANEILSLVYAHCIDYKSINQMERWFERTDLNMMLNIEGLTERRLLEALDSLEAMNPEKLQRDIFSSVQEKYNLKNSGIIYDVTNTYLYGKKCSLGKFGHDKEGVKGRPLIQIGLGVTKDEGIPVFHKTFDGNIHDSKTLQDLITMFRPYKLQSGIIVYDRGITSGQNIADFKALKWDTICGVPLTEHIKKFWRPIIQENNLLELKNRIKLNKTIFYAISKLYLFNTVKGELTLCFNKQQQLDLRESRHDELLHAQELLQKGKKIKSGLEKFFDKNHTIVSKAVNKAQEFDGYSCIFSTRKVPKDSVIHIYFDKDLVEKAFRSLKGIASLRPIRHWLYQRVTAHVFICYLSYLLLSLLKLHLSHLQISPDEALRELDTMYKVYLKDSKNTLQISRTVTLSKKQETILKAIDKKLATNIKS